MTFYITFYSFIFLETLHCITQLMEINKVIIIGAGPAGLAVAACLSVLGIPYVIIEREDCAASLWKRRAYDRLKLHLARQFCVLPHMPFPPKTPKYVPRNNFVRYLDAYVDHFHIEPVYCTNVESATYDENSRIWVVSGHNTETGEAKEFKGGFLVVATGENGEGFIPNVAGLDGFDGKVIHSSQYKSGAEFNGKKVLVVGSGNSGMEIAYDLANHGAMTSIAVRSPFHVLTKEMVCTGMVLLKYLPVSIVDRIVLLMGKIKYGSLNKYGIVRPREGPFLLKATKGRSAVIDVGTVRKIKTGEIQVFSGIASVENDQVFFSDGKSHHFDAIVFATGYRSTASQWLKDKSNMLNQDGLPSQGFPNHWKGSNGVYCAGLAQRGLAGISSDAELIANDIHMVIKTYKAV